MNNLRDTFGECEGTISHVKFLLHMSPSQQQNITSFDFFSLRSTHSS